jgi:hypothetical protein
MADGIQFGVQRFNLGLDSIQWQVLVKAPMDLMNTLINPGYTLTNPVNTLTNSAKILTSHVDTPTNPVKALTGFTTNLSPIKAAARSVQKFRSVKNNSVFE